MKKIISLALVIALSLMLVSCTKSSSDLPSGRAASVVVDNVGTRFALGSGSFKYLNETTIEFVRDYDGKTYYLSTATLVCIEVE